MRFEVAGKKFQRALDGRPGHGDEIAIPFAFVEGQDFGELFQDRLAALTLLNFSYQHGERVCFHTAGGALAAGFRPKAVLEGATVLPVEIHLRKLN